MRGGLAALALAALLTLLPGAGGLRVASAGDPARPGEGEAKGARRADAGADARFAKFVGPSDCGECHENEWKALRLSAHHRSWLELHRRPEAKRIVLALDGPRRIDKREDCASCHYTRKRVEQEAKLVAGVSCESCHGAGKDWLNLHWEGEGEALEKNLAASAEKGMVRPQQLIDMVRRCLDCHVVGGDKLVGVAGHKTGADFDMVSWLQGEVRHNFLRSESYEVNRPTAPARLRRYQVAGAILQLRARLAAFSRLEDRKGPAAKALGRDVLASYRSIKAMRGRLPALGRVQELLSDLKLAEAGRADFQEVLVGLDRLAERLAGADSEVDLSPIQPLLPEDRRGSPRSFPSGG